MQRSLWLLIALLVFSFPVFADDTAEDPKPDVPKLETTTEVVVVPELSPEEIKAQEEKQKQQNAFDSLSSTQLALEEKIKEQSTLQRQLKTADATQKTEMQAQLDKLAAEIKNLKTTFEQVAIGGISLESFGQKEKEFDWKQELVLITQPVLESLKDLTEKPRKTERLRSIVADRTLQAKEIDRAIASVQSRIAANPPKTLLPVLKETLESWEGRKKDNLREIELAQFQLESLLGNNEPWYESFSTAMKAFFGGRGTTLFIALIASFLVWLAMKTILWLLLFRKRNASGEKQKPQTRYRVALYLYKVLTTLLIIMTVVIVLYVRGDLLLLALMIIVIVGMALALRELLPRYINEARALLNLGTIREGERVFYNGIPWQVAHINVHTIFRNPELFGVLRVPLSEVVGLNSRPLSRDEAWFPSNKGDFLLMPDGAVAEVLSQTPENVELQSRGGMRLTYPTQSLYGMEFYNLTRGGSYGVASTFGIDYSHVGVCLTDVPEKFKEFVGEGLRSAGLGEHVLDVMVDFKVANSSSLDFLIYVTMHSRIASSYFKIERVIQQSCVRACNDNNWGIPFPQMTIHRPE